MLEYVIYRDLDFLKLVLLNHLTPKPSTHPPLCLGFMVLCTCKSRFRKSPCAHIVYTAGAHEKRTISEMSFAAEPDTKRV